MTLKTLLTRSLPALLLVLLGTGLAHAQAAKVAGDWEGALPDGRHIVLHFTADTATALSGTVDSPDQGAFDIPLSDVTFKDGALSAAVPAAQGLYKGSLSADGKTLTGTWTQGGGEPISLSFTRSAVSPTPPAPPKPAASPQATAASGPSINGTWKGALEIGDVQLHLVLHVSTPATGLSITLDSPDQGAMGIPCREVVRDGNSFAFHGPAGGTFAGTISKDATTITGKWSQSGHELPIVFTLSHDAAALPPRRPQMPSKPYPYSEEEVSFSNPKAGDTLAGFFTLPKGKGLFPAVVLIGGSGPQDRDESILGHKFFLVLSDYLTRRGVAVLRYDKRGVAKSTGEYATATTADFASDAEAAVAYLKSRKEVNGRRIGLIGHSEGGTIAPIVAADDHDVTFAVLLAGTGVPGQEILREQLRLISLAGGMPAEEVEKNVAMEQKVLTAIAMENDPAKRDSEIRDVLKDRIPPAALDVTVKNMTSPWYLSFIRYDPATALRRVKVPVLALGGSKDLQVPAATNLAAIHKALTEADNKHVEIVELPGLNHLFQTADTGAPSEYGDIEETVSPVVLEKVTNWVLSQK